MRKTFSTTRTIKQRSRLPGEAVPCEPYGMEKISWLICLGAGGWTEHPEVALTLDNPKVLVLSSKLFPHMLKTENYEASVQCFNNKLSEGWVFRVVIKM